MFKRAIASAALAPVIMFGALAIPSIAHSASTSTRAERPPKPEPPYPGAENGDFAADPSANASQTRDVEIIDEVEAKASSRVERPEKIGDDDVYIYSTKKEAARKPSLRKGIALPMGVGDSDEFIYNTEESAPKAIHRPEIEQPIMTTTRGEYHYKIDERKSKGAASFRIGAITAPKATNKDNGATFADLYGADPKPIMFGDYEWRLTSRIGRFSIKFGTGLMYANGVGKFKNSNANRSTADIPEERFNFILLPNQLTAVYKFQYAEKQVLVPFVEGGGGYFAIAEIRDDFVKRRFAGVPVGVAAGGLHFLLDWLDPSMVHELDNQYGINHVWLTAELRQIVSSTSPVDMNSTSVNGGFLMEF